MTRSRFLSIALVKLVGSCSASTGLRPIPQHLVVLTFDDGNKSDRVFVGPLLKKYGFGATFFINRDGGFPRDPERFLTWDDIRWLHESGFEIGNHTANHLDIRKLSKTEFAAELEAIEAGCLRHGIPRPISFCYPGYHSSRAAVDGLSERGYLFARRGVAPEAPISDHGDCGPPYNPLEDHPLLIPTTGASGPNWRSLSDFVSAVNQAKDGKIAVLTFHGVPALLHPSVSTDPELFQACMEYLRKSRFTVIALRDLARYIDPRRRPADPYAPIDARLRLVPADLNCRLDDGGHPEFGWTCPSGQGQKQSGYQILVASRRNDLDADAGDLWDSSKVPSEQSTGIRYGGVPLERGATYWWKARVWNQPNDVLIPRFRVSFDEATVSEFKAEKAGAYSRPAVGCSR